MGTVAHGDGRPMVPSVVRVEPVNADGVYGQHTVVKSLAAGQVGKQVADAGTASGATPTAASRPSPCGALRGRDPLMLRI